MQEPLVNWAGNYRYSTDRLHHAASVGDVQSFVRQHQHLRVLGTRHGFNGIADSAHDLLSIRGMARVLAVNASAGTVTVEGGISYGQLCPELDRHGFALHNLASLPHISVAGACATATHGSGVANGNLATAVSALEIVTASGDIVTLSRDRDPVNFHGAVVNLGALGVVTRLTLDVEPRYDMRQDVYLHLPLAHVADHFEAIVASGYSVSLFTTWEHDRIDAVWIKRRVADGDAQTADAGFYGAPLASVNVHPIIELSAEPCTAQMGVPGPWYERLPHFRMGFTPSSGTELQSESFVPRQHAVDAIATVQRLRAQVSPLLMVSELRTVDADELWLSPCYRQPSLAMHFTWKPDWDAVRQVLPMIERELSPFGVRPHWGKLFTLAPDTLQARYEKCDEFRRLAAQFDPTATFRNAFLAATLYRA